MKPTSWLALSGVLFAVACGSTSVPVDAGSPSDGGSIDSAPAVVDAAMADGGASGLSIALDAPRALRRGGRGQYALVTPIEGASTTWSITNGTDVTPRPGTDLLVFDPAQTADEVRIAARVTRGAEVGEAEVRIPVVNLTMLASERSNLPAGPTLAVLFSLLRGQRVLLRTEPATEMQLLDFQGRAVRSGLGRIDLRVPVRGSYLLYLPSHSGVTLEVTGARPQTAGEDSMMMPGTTPPQAMATAGSFDSRLMERTGLSTAESLIRAGDRIVEASYDYGVDRTRIAAYAAGARVWEWTSPEDDYVRSLAAGPDGAVYAVGSTGPAGALDASFVAKIGIDGQTQYRTVFEAPGDEFAYGISVDASGRAYVSGMARGTVDGSAPLGDLDAFVVVVDATGAPVARRSFGTTGSDRVFASCPLSDGALLFGDSSGAIGTLDTALGPGGSVDLFLARVDATGTPTFIHRFGSDRPDLAFSCAVDGTGGVYLHGMTRGSLTGGGPPEVTQAYVFRATPEGSVVWARQLGPAEGQSAEAIDVGPEGVSLLFYTNGSFPGGSNTSQGTRASDDAVVARYTTDGTLQWVRQFYDTHERIFARGIAARGNEVFVLQDHVYVPGAPFATVSLDRFVVP